VPELLPREEVVNPPASTCGCCRGTELRKVGEDCTEILEYVPLSFKVAVHVHDLVRCQDCETITQVERGRPGPGLLPHVVVKYADGLPLHRQREIYESQGVELDRSRDPCPAEMFLSATGCGMFATAAPG